MKQQPKIEIYTLTWCPYCRKAKAFFKSKGLNYSEYQIDEGSNNKKEMLKRTDGAKSVPQIFIAGESIGGYDQLMELETSGKLDEQLGIEAENFSEQVWDLVIVGAGPAGLNAAVYGARKGLDVLILAVAMGGQVIETDIIDNYIGNYNVKGLDLVQSFWDHVQQYDVKVKLGSKATGIYKEEDLKVVKTAREEIKAKAVIIATGTHKRKLGVSGEGKFKGKGVHYCAICDGYLYAGEEVAIVGGGNSALEAALDMAKLNSKVNLIVRGDQLKGDQVLRNKIEEEDLIKAYICNGVKEIKGEDKVESVLIRDTDTGKYIDLAVKAVFIEIGLIPNTGFASDLLETNQRNEIIIDASNQTSVAGIWAAGDVTNIEYKQIIVATAEGAKAALGANKFLNG